MQGRHLSLLAIALAGCAATPQPVLNTEPIEVSRDELAEYWVPEGDGRVFIKARITSPQVPCGVVDFRMLIDSNGQVHDFEVVDSEPRRAFDDAARQQAEARSYVPASGNAARTPVRVRNHVSFDTDNADDIDCSELIGDLRSGTD